MHIAIVVTYMVDRGNVTRIWMCSLQMTFPGIYPMYFDEVKYLADIVASL